MGAKGKIIEQNWNTSWNKIKKIWIKFECKKRIIRDYTNEKNLKEFEFLWLNLCFDVVVDIMEKYKRHVKE